MSARRGLGAAVVAVVAVVGCVKPPPRVEPVLDVAPPERWIAAETPDAAPPSAWWEDLGDTELPALIDQALTHNHDLGAAAARVARAAAEAEIAGAALEPSVGAGLAGSRQRQAFVGLPIPGAGRVLSSTSTRFGLSLDTSWEVDLWGRLRAGARAALAEAQAADADLAAARLSIAGQTAKTWFAVVEARQQMELARTSADSYRAIAERVRARYEQGLRPPLDLRLALANLASAEALVADRAAQLEAASRQLQLLVGRYPDGDLGTGYARAELPAPPAVVPAGLPADLVGRRPDLVAAERRLAAAGQRGLAARRALYPSLTLTGSAGTVSDRLGDLLDGDYGVWSLVGNLLQPVFRGGRLRAGVDAAESAEIEALERYAGAVLGAYAEVEAALATEQHLRVRERSLAEAADQLSGARRIAEERYREGVGEFLDVLDLQTRALAAEVQLIAVRRRILDNRIDLHLALGGGFEAPSRAPAPGTPPEEPDS